MKIVLGITGSIAAYKALELLRLLRRKGNEVKVILTDSAVNFVTPLSCQTLSDNEVYIEQFALTRGIKHISLNDWADILVIAPATANIIGKTGSGIADDLLSTTILSFQKPILFVPAMDSGMWNNRILQANIEKLKKNGCNFLEPDSGPLASGKIGKGRFPEIERIYKKILSCYANYKTLTGKKILITGGRTEEDIDTVRVITNRSTGLMALELFEASLCRDADVKMIMGEAGVAVPDDPRIFRVRTSEAMYYALKKHIKWADVLIMAAAVGDYRLAKISSTKIHSEKMAVVFEKNIDLLKAIKGYKKNKFFIGFSVEDIDVLKRAREKIMQKGLDMIVSNPVWVIGKPSTSVVIVKRDGKFMEPGTMTKWELANHLLDLILEKKKNV